MVKQEVASGGGLVARQLAAEGVSRVFGIIDGTYYGLYRSLPEHGIELVSPRHETTAAHMAGAYARLTGQLGVCIASNGPGVANVLPGVAVEQAEGNRVLLVTSSRRTGIAYPDRGGTYQCFDQVGATAAMAKWSVHVPDRARLLELLRRALRCVHTGRPGVVHLDVPEDILNGDGPIDPREHWAPERSRRRAPLAPDPGEVDAAAAMLCAARRPLIHAGSGVVHALAYDELARVARLAMAPVTTSWGARGALAEPSAHAIPMIHTELVDDVRNDADVVLTVGSRLGETDWWGKPPNWAPASEQRMIQVDVDPERLGANKPVDLALVGDARRFLAALGDALEERAGSVDLDGRRARLAAYVEERRRDRAKLDRRLRKAGAPVHPARVPVACQQTFPRDTVWVFDGGNTAVWANFFHQVRVPGALLGTFKFGMLGAGVGQALGAQVACPGRRVVCITGDGALGMHPQEVETAVRHGLPIVYVVLCDGQWGMVKMSQQIATAPLRTVARKVVANRPLPADELVYADFAETRFDRLAQALGAHGERVGHSDELRPALARARDAGAPAIVHVDVDPNEHMWAPRLQVFKKLHEEPSGEPRGRQR